MTSPSDGIRSPASTSTIWPGPSLLAVVGTVSPVFSSTMSFALVSSRVCRSVDACALPRPSATASAKFANRMVNQSQTMIWNAKPRFSPPLVMSRINNTVAKAATTSTTNITGFLMSVRGSSFAKAEPMAGTMIFGSVKAATGIRFRTWEACMAGSS